MKFYRYEETRVANIGVRVHLREWKLLKETPKGYWIVPEWDDSAYHKKWVSNSSKKRFAYPSEEDAMKNFIARKKRQIEILKYKLKDARDALNEGLYQRRKENV